jgi:hypothetical protein
MVLKLVALKDEMRVERKAESMALKKVASKDEMLAVE